MSASSVQCSRTRSNGVVLYEGPSRIDGKPIVAIATGLVKRTKNSKMGSAIAIVQTWILRADMHPIEALATGADVSICGGCKFRPVAHNGLTFSGRACYVSMKPTLSIWAAYKRGGYPRVATSKLGPLFAGKGFRLGSYGDPAAVPLAIWQAAVAEAAFSVGYTHQWRSAKLRDVTALCMASCDNAGDVERASALGLGTFRVRAIDETLAPGERVCPGECRATARVNVRRVPGMRWQRERAHCDCRTWNWQSELPACVAGTTGREFEMVQTLLERQRTVARMTPEERDELRAILDGHAEDDAIATGQAERGTPSRDGSAYDTLDEARGRN